MTELAEIFSPDFLLRNSVWLNLLLGGICPLAGVYIVLRRQIFFAVALPPISSCGIAFAFWAAAAGLPLFAGVEDEQLLAFGGSLLFTLTAVALLAAFSSRNIATGKIAVIYAGATAGSILLLAGNPMAEMSLLHLLKGEIIAVSDFQLKAAAALLFTCAALLLGCRKQLLLVSYDRELALVLRKNVFAWELALHLLIGAVVSVAVMSAGVIASFGFLVLPPLTALLIARTTTALLVWSVAAGLIGSFAGFYFAYVWDLPAGATNAAAMVVVYLIVAAFSFLRNRSS